jgi:hypothetical protein
MKNEGGPRRAIAGNPTHGDFADILSLAGKDLRSLCVLLRRLIASTHADFVEIVWPRQHIASYGVGPSKMSEHYAYISVQESYVNLGFYHGAALPDPQGLLEGSGKKLRHIKIRSAADARRAGVSALLRHAVADRKRHAGRV